MLLSGTAARRVALGARPARELHPLAWWIWALGLATAVSRTVNPLLLLLVLAVLALAVSARRTGAPWARAYPYYLGVALSVIAIRVTFRAVFSGGVEAGDHVVFRLPQGSAAALVRGRVDRWAGHTGGRAVGRAGPSAAGRSALLPGRGQHAGEPRRVLQLLPGALYELGAAFTVAVSVAPQLVESVQRVRRATRLRGGAGRGARAIAVPTLHDALKRSLRLAAGMDARAASTTGPSGR